MASSLFGTNQTSPLIPQNNPMELLRQFNEFKRSMTGKNPQQIIQNMISSGRMSQQQFEQLKTAASQLQSILR